MAKVAVILADGFEEIEALTPVDVLRRADIECDTIGLTGECVTGSHGIPVLADKVFDGDLSIYDMIVLPGGMPGSANLRDHDILIQALQKQSASGKYLAAICAAPIVLNRAGLLAGKKYTCFPGQEADIEQGHHQTDLVVIDDHIVTSRGAGTALAFAYKLVDLLGGNGNKLAQAMVYNQLFD
ncbi:intracellular protease 1 (Intracellular protease I) [Streptococcus varani]|uniref:Intracellular protease 1 (Intracellular protease I) n=1 Tax=Streptococcus varani TaxID=1608583 RepID=A0A0E4CSZ4_9STRE|nr:DJ-1 family glyoxalase III [Streptococcus varani]CQR25119.1 intracellular protease 1 (Intracellular protease I) [Streptococcus varani]